MSPEHYTHGHHESVLRSHLWRTAYNSAAYLLAVLQPGKTILDVGCGPGNITIDFAQLVGLRLNEHTLHTWDVEVAGDPSAALAPTGTALVIDNLQLITRFTGKAKADGRAVLVRTTDPARDFSLTTGPEAVALAAGEGGAPDLTLPAEAFIRLVYGRLDPDHTPPVRGNVDLDELRRTFPGV